MTNGRFDVTAATAGGNWSEQRVDSFCVSQRWVIVDGPLGQALAIYVRRRYVVSNNFSLTPSLSLFIVTIDLALPLHGVANLLVNINLSAARGKGFHHKCLQWSFSDPLALPSSSSPFGFCLLSPSLALRLSVTPFRLWFPLPFPLAVFLVLSLCPPVQCSGPIY